MFKPPSLTSLGLPQRSLGFDNALVAYGVARLAQPTSSLTVSAFPGLTLGVSCPLPPVSSQPANVFLGEGGVLKLGDLGLGRSFSSRTLEANTVCSEPPPNKNTTPPKPTTCKLLGHEIRNPDADREKSVGGVQVVGTPYYMAPEVMDNSSYAYPVPPQHNAAAPMLNTPRAAPRRDLAATADVT
eukprot:3212330-Rhodomonas_salina.4